MAWSIWQSLTARDRIKGKSRRPAEPLPREAAEKHDPPSLNLLLEIFESHSQKNQPAPSERAPSPRKQG